jgi:DNA-binding response OmpR family regulator
VKFSVRSSAGSRREAIIRILLVEDNPDLVPRVTGGLQAEGFVMDHATDGEAGCARPDTIAVFAGRLRRKPGRESIETLRGLGYLFG